MFVFFSKLVPLFVYPLGFACLLMGITLILWWKRPAWTPFPIAIALMGILLFSNTWVTNALVTSLEWRILPQDIPKAQAIVILGGATKSASYPRPMVDVNEQGDRVLYAAQLYRDGKAPLIIASGGRIGWLSHEQPESADMAKLLELMGVPPEAIIQEPDSLNTYQNAVNVKKILDEKGITEILLVTSALHLPRSLAIFEKQGIKAIPAPTDFLVSRSDVEATNTSLQAIILNSMPDAHRLDKSTQALKEYLGMLIYRLQGWL